MTKIEIECNIPNFQPCSIFYCGMYVVLCVVYVTMNIVRNTSCRRLSFYVDAPAFKLHCIPAPLHCREPASITTHNLLLHTVMSSGGKRSGSNNNLDETGRPFKRLRFLQEEMSTACIILFTVAVAVTNRSCDHGYPTHRTGSFVSAARNRLLKARFMVTAN